MRMTAKRVFWLSILVLPLLYQNCSQSVRDESRDNLKASQLSQPDGATETPLPAAPTPVPNPVPTPTPVARKIVFVGDSITAGAGLRFKQLFSNDQVFNYGVPGDRTAELVSANRGLSMTPPMSASMDLVLDLAPDIIVVLIGINDLKNSAIKEMNATGLPGSSWDNLAMFAAKLKARTKARVIIQSVMPVYERLHFADMLQYLAIEPILVRVRNSEIIQFNQRLKAYSATNGFEYLDLWPQFTTASGVPYASSFTSDGLHLAEDGYRRWEKALAIKLGASGTLQPPLNGDLVVAPDSRGPGLSEGPFVYGNRVYYSSGTGLYCQFLNPPSAIGLRVVPDFFINMDADGYCER